MSVQHYINLVKEDSPTYYWPCQEPVGATTIRNIGSGSSADLSITSGATGNPSGPIGHLCHGPNSMAINVTPNANANTTGYTLEAWMAVTATPVDGAIVANWSTSGTMMYLSGGFISMYHNSSSLITTYLIPTDGSWHHYALTWNGSTQLLYVDATIHTTRNSITGVLGSAQRLGIGDYRPDGGTNHARIAHAAWFVNSALTQTRIQRRMEVMRASGVAY